MSRFDLMINPGPDIEAYFPPNVPDSDFETQRVIRRFIEGLTYLTRSATYEIVFRKYVTVVAPDEDLKALDRFFQSYPGQGYLIYTEQKPWTEERNRRRSTRSSS